MSGDKPMRKPITTETTDSLIYSNLRELVAFTVPKEAQNYMAWMKAKAQNMTRHHVCGSVMHRRSTDWLIVNVPLEEHQLHQNDPEWNQWQVVPAIKNLIEYTVKIETERNALIKERDKLLAECNRLADLIDGQEEVKLTV